MKYVKRRETVEAVVFDEEAWERGERYMGVFANPTGYKSHVQPLIDCEDGYTVLNDGDYIIKSDKGYSVMQRIEFLLEYEPAEQEKASKSELIAHFENNKNKLELRGQGLRWDTVVEMEEHRHLSN